MNIIRPMLLALLLAVPDVASAVRIYQSTGPDGVTQFSDQPSPQARELDISVPTQVPAAQPPGAYDKPTATETSTAPEAIRYTRLRITQPSNDAVFWFADGPVLVQADIVPPLAEGHVLVPLLDGVAQGEGATGNSFTLSGLNPNTYQLKVVIRDQNGKNLKQSATVRFHFKRQSVNLPARRPPPATGN